MLVATRKPASQSLGFVFADSHFLLSCLAATRSSGSLGSVSVETPGRVQEAAAIIGFVFRTHRGSEAVQGNAATRLMASQVCLNWVRFMIFHFFSGAIRPDFARAPAATSRRTGGIDRTGRSRMPRTRRWSFVAWPAAAGRLIACNRIDKDRADPPRERGKPTTSSMVQVEPRRAAPSDEESRGLLRVVRDLAASDSNRTCVARPFGGPRDAEVAFSAKWDRALGLTAECLRIAALSQPPTRNARSPGRRRDRYRCPGGRPLLRTNDGRRRGLQGLSLFVSKCAYRLAEHTGNFTVGFRAQQIDLRLGPSLHQAGNTKALVSSP